MSRFEQPEENAPSPAPWRSLGMIAVRYGIGGAMILAGTGLLMLAPGELGAHGFVLAVGAGLSVLLLNFLFRMSMSGDRDREREEQARRYSDEHGVWPEEEERPSGRRWTLPAGVVTAEKERERRASRCRSPQLASR